MTNGQEQTSSNKNNASRKRKKQYAASTVNSSSLQESARRLKSLRTANSNGDECCCNSTCTGKLREDINSCFCCCATSRIGEMLVLSEKKDGTPRIIAGPEWPMCICCTVPMIIIGSALITYYIFVDADDQIVPLWILPIYLIIVIVTLLSLFFVGCRDPGLLERCTDEEAAESGWFWNEQCGSFRPSHATYCKELKVLIEDYDHVCPWTGTAIGKGNMLAFRFFLVFSNVLCYSTIAIVVYCVLNETKE